MPTLPCPPSQVVRTKPELQANSKCWCKGGWKGPHLCPGVFICMMKNMKWHIAIVSICLGAALAVPTQSVAGRDRIETDSATIGEATSQLSSGMLKNDLPIQPPAAASSMPLSSSGFREIPSISGRYAIGGTTLLPYIGAGFSGGYSSELNRSLGGASPTLSDIGLRGQFGQSVSPNEFQMGIRIPF